MKGQLFEYAVLFHPKPTKDPALRQGMHSNRSAETVPATFSNVKKATSYNLAKVRGA
jgi:hypothetical protein